MGKLSTQIGTLHSLCPWRRPAVGQKYSAARTGILFEHLGPAVPLFVNFGISGVERILRELRAALSRRGREMVLARHSARQALRDELKDDVTALLLSCGIALEETVLSESAIERLKRIRELANQIKTKLAISNGESAAVVS